MTTQTPLPKPPRAAHRRKPADLLYTLDLVPVPQDYDTWFEHCLALERIGFGVDDIERWCSRGQKYRPGEWVEKRAQDLERYEGRKITGASWLHICVQHGVMGAGEPGEGQGYTPWHFRPVLPDELLAIEPLEWLVEGLLPRDCLVMFSGDPKAGKSSMLTAWATRDEWMGRSIKPARWLHITEEDPRWIKERLDACGVTPTNDLMADRYLPAVHSWADPWSYPGLLQELHHVVERTRNDPQVTPIDVVVLDTMLYWADMQDINDANSVKGAMQPLKDLRAALPGVTIVAVHHNRKPQSDAGDVFSSFLGSTVFRGYSDFNLIMTKRESALSLHAEGRGNLGNSRIDITARKDDDGVINWSERAGLTDVLAVLQDRELDANAILDAMDEEDLKLDTLRRRLSNYVRRGQLQSRKAGRHTLYSTVPAE